MEHRLARIAPKWAEDLDPNEYLFSLLDAACQAKLIADSDVEDIHTQIMDVLKDVVTKYTSGESSSVQVETAQNLLLSISYCVDAYCMSFPTPEECLAELKTTSIHDIYKKGLSLVRSCFDETKKLFIATRSEQLVTKIVAYNSTVGEGIPGFFANYNIQFNAHETTADIDYPLASDPMNQRGIFYISQYIRTLSTENQFCNLFERSEVDMLLENYGRTYRIDYPEFLLNIFEIVLTNAIFSLLLGRDPRILAISTGECAILNEKLNKISARDIPVVLNKAIDKLAEELAITAPDICSYIRQYEKSLTPRLINALQLDSLNKLLITDQPAKAHPRATFEQGDIMNDEALRDLIELILECPNAVKKADIILTNVRSLDDFMEILAADCVFDEEYQTVYESLGDVELSLLVWTIVADELRSSDGSLLELLAQTPNSEREWINQLISFMKLIEPDRSKRIEELVKEIGDTN
ncbi:MAG: DUF6179 domain-containing protein [Acidobacteriota bacterium]